MTCAGPMAGSGTHYAQAMVDQTPRFEGKRKKKRKKKK